MTIKSRNVLLDEIEAQMDYWRELQEEAHKHLEPFEKCDWDDLMECLERCYEFIETS
jgi:hypothetical protein